MLATKLLACCVPATDPRGYQHAPQHDGQWAIATNGFVMMRVPVATVPGLLKLPVQGNYAKAWGQMIEDARTRCRRFNSVPTLENPPNCQACPRPIRAEECAACRAPLPVGPDHYDRLSLALLCDLPGLKIASSDTYDHAYWQAEGADGLIKPLRPW